MSGLPFNRGWQGGRRSGIAWLALGVWLFATAFGHAAPSGPRIESIQRRGTDWVILATAPEGMARLVLEGSQRSELGGWTPRGVARLGPGQKEATFVLLGGGRSELFRVRADDKDPLPTSFYTGRTNFADAAALFTGGPGAVDDAVSVPRTEVKQVEPRSVVESDIWKVEGDRMYFFNQNRGLQVLNVANPDAPTVEGTFALAGAGEQMYVLGGRHAVLLANDACNAWAQDGESAVRIIDTGVHPYAEAARLPIRGRIVESRMVGDALYVASDTWRPRADGSGTWEAGTWVHAFDLADPAKPIARDVLWFPGSGNVVTATDRFLFVSIIDYSRNWPWKSDLQVVDISAPNGAMAAFTKIPLAGHVADKFKIDLLGDVLRVVVESTETAQNSRWVTVLETYRLADPRAAGPMAFAKLDRLELARGERLFATRFDGERGYIVTFLRVDPLWIIDLSDPTNLRVAGELEIPGWSTYLRPMGDRLLTMGIDDVKGWRVAVQMFDVGNPAKPALLSKISLGENSSWSEANQDEKAFGVFPEAGLLLVPLSSWSSLGGGVQGVQLLDFDRNGLKQRGFLASSSVVPRRATARADRVLTVSGRELATANIADRDRPTLTATLELAYPVERVLTFGGHLLEFQSGSVRVRPLAGDETKSRKFALSDFPILGATIRSNRLHLLQGRAAEFFWEQPPGATEGVTRTNAGVLLATTWDLAQLPEVVQIGKATAEFQESWIPDVKANWPGSDTLVWSTDVNGRGFWPLAMDIAIRPGGPGGGWFPWWLPPERKLVVVALDPAGVPRGLRTMALAGEGQPAGEVASGGGLVFSTRQIGHSEITSTNVLVESVWTALPPVWVTNLVKQSDGTVREEVRQYFPSEYRKQTNSYPVFRWWSSFELDVIDFAADATAPTRRSALPIGGALIGVSHEGSLIYVSATREVVDGKGAQRSWLEASAYDGVSTHRIDSMVVADFGMGETAASGNWGADVFVARGGYEAKAVHRVERWRLGSDGLWKKLGSAALSSAPGELRVVGDLVAVRADAGLEVFQIGSPEQIAPLPVLALPWCYGGDLTKADGESTGGLWWPYGEFGSIRVAGGP